MVNSRKPAARRLIAALVLALSASSGADAALAAITGPDVSNWQHPNGASINWNLVKAAGHSFAFVKATEGTGYTNPNFAGDWSAILAAGMDRGPYHFARPELPAADQANYFISVTGNTREPGTSPVLDLEQTGGLAPPQLVQWTQTFLSTVQSLTGRTPMIYVSPNSGERPWGIRRRSPPTRSGSRSGMATPRRPSHYRVLGPAGPSGSTPPPAASPGSRGTLTCPATAAISPRCKGWPSGARRAAPPTRRPPPGPTSTACCSTVAAAVPWRSTP